MILRCQGNNGGSSRQYTLSLGMSPKCSLPLIREETLIRSSPELGRFEREYARSRGEMTYAQSLEIFEALWEEAMALNPDFPGDWEADLAPDFAIARAVNGLPPDA